MLVTPARLRRAAVAIAIAGALSALSSAAEAHGELISSTPADGAALADLPSVRLEFSEDLLDIGNSVQEFTDSTGAAQDLVLSYPQPNVIEAPVNQVASGPVVIDWRNASVDGHTEEGQLHVTVEAAAATPGSTATQEAIATSPDPLPTAAEPPLRWRSQPVAARHPWNRAHRWRSRGDHCRDQASAG